MALDQATSVIVLISLTLFLLQPRPIAKILLRSGAICLVWILGTIQKYFVEALVQTLFSLRHEISVELKRARPLMWGSIAPRMIVHAPNHGWYCRRVPLTLEPTVHLVVSAVQTLNPVLEDRLIAAAPQKQVPRTSVAMSYYHWSVTKRDHSFWGPLTWTEIHAWMHATKVTST